MKADPGARAHRRLRAAEPPAPTQRPAPAAPTALTAPNAPNAPNAPTLTASTAPTIGHLLRGLPPEIGRDARVVVLGSFPSAASLAASQYYAHPRNQFWPLMSALFATDLRALLYRCRLAVLCGYGVGLWDVYASCRREGSLDSAIEDAVLNDLASLPRRAPRLQALLHNGGESARAMRITRTLGLPVRQLPSTSPANASWSFERKRAAWRAAFEDCGVEIP